MQRLKVLSSMATREVVRHLAELHARATGHVVEHEAAGGVDVAKRVRRGEAVDVVVLAQDAIDELVTDGFLMPGSGVELVRSGIAVAVRADAARPPIDTEAAVEAAVRNARSVSFSTGPSGIYLTGLLARWGALDAVRGRIVVAPPGVPVATLVARGDVELGFQQLSELVNVAGIAVLGPLPPAIQSITTFTGAVATASADPDEGRALLEFMASPAAADVKRRHGMQEN